MRLSDMELMQTSRKIVSSMSLFYVTIKWKGKGERGRIDPFPSWDLGEAPGRRCHMLLQLLQVFSVCIKSGHIPGTVSNARCDDGSE